MQQYHYVMNSETVKCHRVTRDQESLYTEERHLSTLTLKENYFIG